MSHINSVTVCIRHACLVRNQSGVKQHHCHLHSRECCSAGTTRSVATTSLTHFYELCAAYAHGHDCCTSPLMKENPTGLTDAMVRLSYLVC